MKSKRQRIIEANIQSFKSLESTFLEDARLYKEKHKDWNKMPDLKAVKIICALVYIHGDVRHLPELSFCRLKVESIDNWSIKCKYSIECKPSLFASPRKYDFDIEIHTPEFNKTWFISHEVAGQEVARRIDKGEIFNPTLLDLVPHGTMSDLLIGKSH